MNADALARYMAKSSPAMVFIISIKKAISIYQHLHKGIDK